MNRFTYNKMGYFGGENLGLLGPNSELSANLHDLHSHSIYLLMSEIPC